MTEENVGRPAPPMGPGGPGGPGGPMGGGPGGPGGPGGGPGGPGGRPPMRRGGGRGRYPPRRRVCQFCVDKIKHVDYKDVSRLRRYLSDRAKIEPRRKTGTCAHHQRQLSVALKRARFMALLPYTAEHIRQSGMVMRG
ncbi:MAG: small subunit ribosomal protein [Chloroflexota bacterium]|nr:small subunit ribosomal protein [Chloroflexota bacterium]